MLETFCHFYPQMGYKNGFMSLTWLDNRNPWLKIVKLLQCEMRWNYIFVVYDESLKMNVFKTKKYFEMKTTIVAGAMVVGAMEYTWQCEVYFIISFSLSVQVD